MRGIVAFVTEDPYKVRYEHDVKNTPGVDTSYQSIVESGDGWLLCFRDGLLVQAVNKAFIVVIQYGEIE